MFERFTARARRAVVNAQQEARELNHNYIGTEHLLLGLMREPESVAARALQELKISQDTVREQVIQIVGRGQQPPSGHVPFTPRAKKVLELSLREALQLSHNYIGTEHILLGLVREGEGVASQVLHKLGADLNRVRQTVIQLLSGYTAGVDTASKAEGETEMAELTREMGRVSELPEDAPTCSNCFAALDETLAIRTVETTSEGETMSVRIAYCSRCGVAIGTVM